jgi:hypothetical protein
LYGSQFHGCFFFRLKYRLDLNTITEFSDVNCKISTAYPVDLSDLRSMKRLLFLIVAYCGMLPLLASASPTTQQVKLTGATLGTSGSFQNGPNTKDKALDGKLDTYFDAPNTDAAWVGLDLGKPTKISQVSFCPRKGFPKRMIGGVFQGSNDGFKTATIFASVQSTPAEGVLTTLPVSDQTSYRYVRYAAPKDDYGNVAEIQFYTVVTVTPTPTPTTVPTPQPTSRPASTQVVNVGPNRSIKNINDVKLPGSGGSLLILLDPQDKPYPVKPFNVASGSYVEITSSELSNRAGLGFPDVWPDKNPSGPDLGVPASPATIIVSGTLNIHGVSLCGGEDIIALGTANPNAVIYGEDLKVPDGGGVIRGSGGKLFYFRKIEYHGIPRAYVFANFTNSLDRFILDNREVNTTINQGGHIIKGVTAGEAAIRICDFTRRRCWV